MAFKFLPVAVAVFIVKFGTSNKADHDNCFIYDVVTKETGTVHREIYKKCGITGYDTVNENEKLECVAKAFKLVNDDGSMNRTKLRRVLKEYTYREHICDVLKMTDKSLKKPKEFLTLFAQGVYKLCPRDEIYGKPCNSKE